jgi:prepilin-type N-terminal cleavage/methylation domain-containing protein
MTFIGKFIFGYDTELICSFRDHSQRGGARAEEFASRRISVSRNEYINDVSMQLNQQIDFETRNFSAEKFLSLRTGLNMLGYVQPSRMVSKPTCWSRISAGFSMMEMIIVIAMITLLAGIGTVVGLDSYQRYLFRADVQNAISLLQHTRMQAVNNIGSTNHSVQIGSTEVEFEQLSGRSTDSTITLTDGVRAATIIISNEGGIDW